MAFALLKKNQEQVEKFLGSVREAKENIKYCSSCFNLTTNEGFCEVCQSRAATAKQICIIESVKDLIAIERTKEYTGLYHVLGGVISPLDGIGATDLNIPSLLERIKTFLKDSGQLELIMALGLSTEGEATILYLKRLLEQELNPEETSWLQITRLAHGLPAGADLDYTDELTLARALQGRVVC
jgi:recombination protein RecR